MITGQRPNEDDFLKRAHHGASTKLKEDYDIDDENQINEEFCKTLGRVKDGLGTQGALRQRIASRKQLTSSLINEFIQDAEGIFGRQPSSPSSDRYSYKLKVSDTIRIRQQVLYAFTWEAAIAGRPGIILKHKVQQILKSIWDAVLINPHLLPENWWVLIDQASDPQEKARIVCDYVAGMTDDFALQFYEHLFHAKAGWDPRELR